MGVTNNFKLLIIVVTLHLNGARANHYIGLLREYLEYANGISSYDTIERVIGMIDSEYIRQAYNNLTSMLEKEKIKKVAIDGKTMRGNKKNTGKPNRIITAWNCEDGYSL